MVARERKPRPSRVASRPLRGQQAPTPAFRAVAVNNSDVAATFDQIADLLDLEDASPFRVRAYRNAARIVRDLTRGVCAMLEDGEDLTELPGIGKDLAEKIRSICETGESPMLADLGKKTPPALTALLRVPGLGPKKVRAIHRALGVRTLDDLMAAAKEGRIRDLRGFGEKTEQRILREIELKRPAWARFKLSEVTSPAEALVRFLRGVPTVEQAIVAGSFRRSKDTVGDLDILVTARANSDVMDRLASHPDVREITARGTTRTTVILRSGLQVDVRLVPREAYGAALHYFTGSKAHNIAVRALGVEKGLKINEYGVFRGDRRVAGDTEESVFACVGLPYIPPELREDRGEIAAAQTGRLPSLIEPEHILGDLHAHSKATDGRNSIREMAEAARARGYEYLAITDHSRRVTVARGLTPERLLTHIAEIDEANGALDGIEILKGIEVDILEDGSLDLPADVLACLDVVVGAVHSKFDLPREAQTRRILRAMDHPHFSILAHPTGRLIHEREPCDVDMERIVRHAKQRGCFLELNAQPDRLDLSDVHAQMARDEGVLVAIDTDAHSVIELDHIRFGIGQARRAWLEKQHVLNTRPLAELRRLLSETRRPSSRRMKP